VIRLIAAIDSKRGLANEHGIPWQGKIPVDVRYFRDQTRGSNILMGRTTYTEFVKPLPDRKSFVLTHNLATLNSGFEVVHNLDEFIELYKNEGNNDLWVIGGANLFAQTIVQADELYLTQLNKDFHCTKFFPAFEQYFELFHKSAAQQENSITYHFEIWKNVKTTVI